MRSALLASLFALTATCRCAETLRFRLVPRETVEARLRDYEGTNRERGARIERMFVDAGCGDHVSEQSAWGPRTPPNVICVLPGTSDRVIIVGAHFDHVPESKGVADNWSGASLLPSLYEAVKVDPHEHSYVFVAFTDEEKGLVGSEAYAHKMTREQAAATDAMINLDTLGLAPTEVWLHRSDQHLAAALVVMANHLKLPISAVNFEQVGSTDSESFVSRKIPRLTIHSLSQKSENARILHTKKDQLSAMNLDDYYDTYHLVSAYLVYLDHLAKN